MPYTELRIHNTVSFPYRVFNGALSQLFCGCERHVIVDSVQYPDFYVFLCHIFFVLEYFTDYPTMPAVYASLGWTLSGWVIHYLPFWFMSRVLYPHHYLPAYIFSCMFIGK